MILRANQPITSEGHIPHRQFLVLWEQLRLQIEENQAQLAVQAQLRVGQTATITRSDTGFQVTYGDGGVQDIAVDSGRVMEVIETPAAGPATTSTYEYDRTGLFIGAVIA